MLAQRRETLQRQFTKACRERNLDEIIRTRFTLLDYSYAEDSGGGSALASITQAAATLGGAYIATQNRSNAVQVPTRTLPAFGAATPTNTSTVLVVVLVIAAAIGGLLYVMRGEHGARSVRHNLRNARRVVFRPRSRYQPHRRPGQHQRHWAARCE